MKLHWHTAMTDSAVHMNYLKAYTLVLCGAAAHP